MSRRQLELIAQRVPETGTIRRVAERAEAAGWDGIALTDSQNLIGDPFIAMALGAQVTERLRFMTGVTNPATRHPAVLATTVATVQEESGGRAVLGIGRGDTALFHLGRKPMPVADFFPAVEQVHTYLNGGEVDQRGRPSRLRWLDRATQPPVPVDVAASGPKVIAFAARTVERITFAVGADPDAGGLGRRPGPHRDARGRSGRRRRVVRGLRERRLPSRSGGRRRADPRRAGRVRPLLGHAGVDRSGSGRARPRAGGRGGTALRQQPAPRERGGPLEHPRRRVRLALRCGRRPRHLRRPPGRAGRSRARSVRGDRLHLRCRPGGGQTVGRAHPRRGPPRPARA